MPPNWLKELDIWFGGLFFWFGATALTLGLLAFLFL
jgi:hypothetical protein